MPIHKWPGHPNAVYGSPYSVTYQEIPLLRTFAEIYGSRPDKRPFIIQEAGSCQQWVVYPIDDQTIASMRCEIGIDTDQESCHLSTNGVWNTIETPNYFILVDTFADETPMERKCTCDFRGANCWNGCTCGFIKGEGK